MLLPAIFRRRNGSFKLDHNFAVRAIFINVANLMRIDKEDSEDLFSGENRIKETL